MTSEGRRAFHFSLKESISHEAKKSKEKESFEIEVGGRERIRVLYIKVITHHQTREGLVLCHTIAFSQLQLKGFYNLLISCGTDNSVLKLLKISRVCEDEQPPGLLPIANTRGHSAQVSCLL